MYKKYCLTLVIAVSVVTVTVVFDFIYNLIGRVTRQVVSSSFNDYQITTIPLPSIPMDVAGVNKPLMVQVKDCDLHDDEIVIGVNVFGESRAYLRSAFDLPVHQHIVNDVIDSIPVTITHCDRTRCTRVLTNSKQDRSVDVRCGGWLATQEMAILVGQTRYPQSSSDIPLVDLPFAMSTWKAWREEHPNSMVYLGAALKGEEDEAIKEVN
jgi:hypothetical protein